MYFLFLYFIYISYNNLVKLNNILNIFIKKDKKYINLIKLKKYIICICYKYK